MGVLFVKIAAALILPPGANVLLGVAALAIWRRAKSLAILLLLASFISLYVFSIPKVGDALFEAVESFPARLPGAAVAEGVAAIVVLGGGRNGNAPEFGGETVALPFLLPRRSSGRRRIGGLSGHGGIVR